MSVLSREVGAAWGPARAHLAALSHDVYTRSAWGSKLAVLSFGARLLGRLFVHLRIHSTSVSHVWSVLH